jgi:hypothetical protein
MIVDDVEDDRETLTMVRVDESLQPIGPVIRQMRCVHTTTFTADGTFAAIIGRQFIRKRSDELPSSSRNDLAADFKTTTVYPVQWLGLVSL